MITASILIGFTAFIFHAFLVIVLLRLLHVEPVLIHIASSILIHLLTFLYYVAYQPGAPYWQGACLYWFLVLAYLYFYSAFYTSVSLAILFQITRDDRHTMPIPTIFEKYVLAYFLERVDMLQKTGHVVCTDGRYAVTPAGRKTARTVRAIQRALFGIEASGLYFLPRDSQQ